MRRQASRSNTIYQNAGRNWRTLKYFHMNTYKYTWNSSQQLRQSFVWIDQCAAIDSELVNTSLYEFTLHEYIYIHNKRFMKSTNRVIEKRAWIRKYETSKWMENKSIYIYINITMILLRTIVATIASRQRWIGIGGNVSKKCCTVDRGRLWESLWGDSIFCMLTKEVSNFQSSARFVVI